jgi:small GTP-binding protein
MGVVKKKVIMLGDGAVGKTSLIQRFVLDRYDDRYIATIGTKVTKKEVAVDGDLLSMMIWDVLGQHGYSATHASSFGGAHGAILVADITRKETLLNLDEHWLPALRKVAGNVPLIYLANKADLLRERQFDEAELLAMARAHNASYFMTSARTGTNVESAFWTFGRTLVQGNGGPAPGVEMPRPHYVVRSEIEAADAIIDHFCGQCVDREWAMDVIRHAFVSAGVNISAPTVEGLQRVLAHLEAVERDFQGEATARGHRIERMKYLTPLSVQ